MTNKNISDLGSVGEKPIEKTNALTLIRDSREYYEYYKRGKPDKKIDISKVSYFLLMRSLELSLKALLKVKEGITVYNMRNKFKHDVSKLYSYCVEQKYLNPLSKETKAALDTLNLYYRDKDFEYTRIGYKTLPHTTYLIPLIENIHNEIDNIFRTTGINKYI